MASIIIPRKWTQQPQYASKLDYNNKLTDRIRLVLLPSVGVIDLVNPSRIWTNTSSHFSRYPRSSFIDYVPSGSNYYTTPFGIGLTQNNITLAAVQSCEAASTSQSPALSVHLAGGAGIGVGIHSNFSGIEYPSMHVNNTVAGSASAEYQLRKITRVCIVTTENSNNHNLYVDNKLALNRIDTLGTFGSSWYIGLGRHYQQNYSAQVISANHNIQLALAWNKTLSLGEIAEFTLNPWQIFKRDPQRLYFDVSTGLPTLTSIAASNITSSGARLTVN